MKYLKTRAIHLFLLLFITTTALATNQQEVYAGTYDNAVTFYNTHGDDVVFKDGFFYYGSKGKIASASKSTTVWNTVGFRMKIQTSSSTTYIYFTSDSSMVDECSSIKSNGYQYQTYRISLDSVKTQLSNKNSAGYQQFLSSGATITIDSCMTTVWIDKYGNRYPAGSMDANGTFSGNVYTTYEGIANAAPWANPSSLRSYFNKTIKYETQLVSQQIVYVRYQQANGHYGSYSAVINKNYVYGEKVSWSRNADSCYNAISTSYTVTGAKTTYLSVTRKKYSVSLNKGTGIATVTGSGSYYYGATCTINAELSTGYTWDKWTGTQTSTQQRYSFTVTSSSSLTANAKLNTYIIKFHGNGNTDGSMNSLSMTYNVTKNLPTNTYVKKGYLFNGWATSVNGIVVYSDGQSVRNLTTTHNGIVNLYASWLPDVDLYPDFITPNSSYRRGTEIIVSYTIFNDGVFDFTPSNAIETVFTATSTNDEGVQRQVANLEKEVIAPAYDKNLVYFKVRIPTDSRTITFDLNISSFAEETTYLNNHIVRTISVTPLATSQTPNTEFENTPVGFRVPSSTTAVPTMGQTIDSNASWQMWDWIGGTFRKNTYGVCFSPTIEITADDTVPSELLSGGVTTIKSGYGIEIKESTVISSDGSHLMPDSGAYTKAQNAFVFFPEYQYSRFLNEYRTLELVGDFLMFTENENTMNERGVRDNRRVHFIPLYFPDGDYVVKSLLYDVWTPDGMINATSTSNQIKIDGNIYEDWFLTNVR